MRHEIPNTFGIETYADQYIEYHSPEELIASTEQFRKDGCVTPFLHIGSGSNLLFTRDFHGMVLHSLIASTQIIASNSSSLTVKVGAGCIWDDFVSYCVENHLYGAENLSMIPGEVGAAAVQNIGAYGEEVKNIIHSVETIDIFTGQKHTFDNGQCQYAYRDSIFKCRDHKRYIITYVVFSLGTREHYNLEYGALSSLSGVDGQLSLSNVRDAIIQMRSGKLPDPKVIGSAGSFFVNPVISRDMFESLSAKYPDMPHYPSGNESADQVKLSAGWLIEQCGWKGKSLGRAGVYSKQSLVLVNLSGATGQEILTLAQAIIDSVHDKFGITLHPEVNIY